MKILNSKDVATVSGGKILSDAEATNAYMMAGSMFFPVVGMAVFKSALPSIASDSVLGPLIQASIIAAGTGIGVWVGYQIYYAIYYGKGYPYN